MTRVAFFSTPTGQVAVNTARWSYCEPLAGHTPPRTRIWLDGTNDSDYLDVFGSFEDVALALTGSEP